MLECCSVCGDWYPHVGRDRREICEGCFGRISQEPNRPWTSTRPWPGRRSKPTSPRPPLTHRQRAAMAHMQAQWRRAMEDET